MKEVTKKEFYNHINPLDVTLSVVGQYPYTTVFQMRNSRRVVGRAVDSFPEDGRYPLVTTYYLSGNEEA